MCAARLTRRLFLVWLNATDSICEGNGHSLKKTVYCVTLHEGDSIWRGWRYVKEAHIIWQRHRVYEGEIDYMKETHLIWKKRSLYERDARYMKKTHIISRHYMDETHTLTPTHTYTNTHTHTHSYTHTHTLTWYRPTQSISYVPFLVWVFYKSIFLIVQILYISALRPDVEVSGKSYAPGCYIDAWIPYGLWLTASGERRIWR